MLRDALGALLFRLAVVLVPALLIGYPVLAWFYVVKRRRPGTAAARRGLAAALVAFPLALALLAWGILRDRSSTAAIALYVVPLLAAAVAALVFLLVWVLVSLGEARHG